MIAYNPRAARAIAFLKRAYNDVEIFVEDTTSLNMWTKILGALLPSTLKLKSVNMLGGRENVLKACKMDQADDGRRKLYIIDGDFDFLCGRKRPRLKYLYRLRAYCVENLLINHHSVVEVAFDSDSSGSRTDAERKIDYANSIQAFDQPLRSLFIVYATAAQLRSKLPTIRFSVRNLLDSRPGSISLSDEKVRLRCRQVLRDLCREQTSREVRYARKEITDRAKALPIEMVVSGKDYLLPVIHLHLCRASGYRGTVEQLKAHLARMFDHRAEPYLKRRVYQLAT